MIPKVKKILYATDLSKNSAYALSYAMNSAKRNDAEIVILHVMEVMDTNTYNLLGTKLISEELVAEKTKENNYASRACKGYWCDQTHGLLLFK